MKNLPFTKQDIKQFWKIRRQLERLQKREPYNYDWDEDLCGACMTGAFLTQCYLKSKGYNSLLVVDQAGHCFVQVEDWIVDITATQFGSKKKVLIESRGHYINTIWKFYSPTYYSSMKNLPRNLKKLDWGTACPIKLFDIKSLYYANT